MRTSETALISVIRELSSLSSNQPASMTTSSL